MNPQFYAFDDSAAALSALPGFLSEIEGELIATNGATIRCHTGGVWITDPVFGEYDPGNRNDPPELIQAGVRSKPFVIITPAPVKGAEDHAISPQSEAVA